MRHLILVFLFSFTLNAQTNSLHKVDSLLLVGDYQMALNVLKKTTKSHSSFSKFGQIYQSVGAFSKAINAYEMALNFKESNLVKEQLGKCYQQNGRRQKAIVIFEELLKINPNNLLLKYHLAKLFYTKKDFKKAKPLFFELRNKDISNSNYSYYLGKIYMNISKKDSAKIHFLNALQKDTSHYKSIYSLAKLYRFYDKDSSYYFLKKGLQINPRSNSLHKLGAKYSFKDRKYKEAINYLDSLKNLNPDFLQLKGIAYYYTKNYRMADSLLINLPKNKKAESTTLFYLSLVKKAQKKYKKATFYMYNAIDAETPELTKYYYQLGLIHQESKDYKMAIEDFNKAIKEDIYNAKAQYQLALTYDGYYKDKNMALKQYQRYLNRFSPNNETTLFAKQRVKEITKMLFLKGEN